MVTWTHQDYGRAGELARLNEIRNDPTKPKWQRSGAARAHAKIREQLKDKRLMAMRLRLIRATQAADETEIMKITKQMRDYLGEDLETGLAGDRG